VSVDRETDFTAFHYAAIINLDIFHGLAYYSARVGGREPQLGFPSLSTLTMPQQTLFLTGAPASASLEWDSGSLLETFTAPVARFARLPSSVSNTANSSSSFAEPRHAAWRSLDIDRQHLSTGHSQVYMWTEEYRGNADFFTTSNISFASSSPDLETLQLLGDPESSSESIEEMLSQFYEHSFAVHATTASSQIAISESREAFNRSSFDSIGTSFTSVTDSPSVSSLLERSPIRPAIPVGSQIVDLRDIPNAKFLDSIQPQTMTVNIIVGIISVAPPRAIKTRRGAVVEIVELLVGDETKSGFGVNFWLSARSNDSDGGRSVDDIRKKLVTIRPQDIVLLRNIALSNFRGKVYGQSLRKEMTKLHLLYRNRIDKTDVGGYYTLGDFDTGKEVHSQLAKTMLVRDWVLRFVGPGAFRRAGKESEVMKESLPLDTQ